MTRLRSSLIGGGVAGLGGGLLFAALHALIIIPIWNRMIGGLVFGVVAGVAGGWAYAELMANPRMSPLRRGATFGILLWLAAVPVTLVNVYLRSIGFAHAHEATTNAIAVVLAILGGAGLGWMRVKRLRGSVAGAAAVVCLTMAMGGPVPMGRGVRATEIFFAVLAASLFGGVVLAYLEPLFRTRSPFTTADPGDIMRR